MMQTIGSVLARNKGIGPGFDFLRVALAVLIVLNHSFLIVNGNFDFIAHYKLWSVFSATVPMFFALSGFLISGSAQRLKLKDFLLNRGMRIVPALAVDILVSAIIIGPIVTTVGLDTYVGDKKFAHYFLNIIGFIHYQLPGVFLSNPFPDQVNGSLWTVPYEIGCYVIMSGLMLFGIIKSGRLICIICAVFAALFYLILLNISSVPIGLSPDGGLYHYLMGFVSGRGNFLYFYFLGGVLAHGLRDKIPCSGLLAGLSAIIILLGFSGLLPLGLIKPLLLALPVAYLTIYIGLLPIGKLPLYSRGDYSYGIYLYAYPLQQILVGLWPGRFSVAGHFLCSVICATLVAMLSWHLIEKPILGLRRKFSFTAHKGDGKPVPLTARPPL